MLSSVVGRSVELSQTKTWFVPGDAELASPVSPSEAPPASVASNQVELSVEYSMPEVAVWEILQVSLSESMRL